ncbi:MAG: P-loop NTPase, partial [bacterium]
RTGKWFVSRSRFDSWFVHAKLGIGQENSGKLVAKVKDEARRLAEREKIAYVIVDGPPGVGCPAISAISGTNHVLIVTEATRSGLHDLKRMVDLTRAFRMSVSCVINKCNLNPEACRDIQLYCDTCGIEVLAYIPYDRVFSEALRAKKTLIEMNDSQVVERIEKIWNRVQSKLANVRRTA